MQPRISMITLGVKDLAASVAFYEKLGWQRHAQSNENIAFFALNGTWLGLYGDAALAEDAGVAHAPGEFHRFACAHNLASEAEVDAAFAEALAAGAAAIKPPQKVFWGGYSGYFADPDGHLWELAHNPFMWVGPEDKK